MKTIKVKRNIWGNHACYIGTERVDTFGLEWDARKWLADKLATGQYKLSPKTDIQPLENK